MLRFLPVFIALSFLSFIALGATQGSVGTLKGQLQYEDGSPVAFATLQLEEAKRMTSSDETGHFEFQNVPYRTYTLTVDYDHESAHEITVVLQSAVQDEGVITLAGVAAGSTDALWEVPMIDMEEAMASADDEGMSNQSISGILTASRDPFLNAASHTFGSLRFQIRGYKRNQLEVLMNGVTMNDFDNKNAIWGIWGGLNDVFRGQNTTFGLKPADEAFGGLLGSTAIDAVAARQWKQTRIGYAMSNRTYRNRIMVTHNTGVMKNGWAVSVSASKRWAKESYIPGTSYDAHSYFLSLSKVFNNKHSIHFTTFGAPNTRGKAMPATQEAMDLVDDPYYNPNWGWQDGEKRNARMGRSFQPIGILNYEYTPTVNSKLNLAFAYQTGYNGNSALDWYNAQDPRPDYYKNLPSYYIYDPRGSNPEMAEVIRNRWASNPDQGQINWDRLYESNRLNYDNSHGINGNRSLYVIGEDRNDMQKYQFSGQYYQQLNPNWNIYTGIQTGIQTTDNYRKLLDLLGGDYYVNLNQFAERTFIGNEEYNQNNLLNPDPTVLEGDRYQYSYKARFEQAKWWGQAFFDYNKWNGFIAAQFGYESFQREGLYQNGLFQDDSYGKSEKYNFFTYDFKGGVTYKIDGRNYLFANGGLLTVAPTFSNTFYSPRTRNATIPNPTLEKIYSFEGGYILNTPTINGRLTGFATEFKDATNVLRYYHESYRTFVNYAMRNIDSRNLGAELAIQGKISPSLSATLVAVWQQAFYTSNPDIEVYRDNDTTTVVDINKVYWENYYVASGPQSAYTLGLNYNSPKYWFANLNFNFLNRSFLEMNPGRLTQEAVDLLPSESNMYQSIVKQEELPSMFTVDIFAGKSFLLNRYFKGLPPRTFLYVNVGVNNLLNNRKIITGGFQQLRFDYATKNPDRFPPKYFYGYGTNFFINVSLKF